MVGKTTQRPVKEKLSSPRPSTLIFRLKANTIVYISATKFFDIALLTILIFFYWQHFFMKRQNSQKREKSKQKYFGFIKYKFIK